MKFKVNKGLTEHILFPLAFLILGVSFLFLTFKPVIKLVSDGFSMFSSESINREEEINNDIYSGEVLEGFGETVPSSKIQYPLSGTKYGMINIEANGSFFEIPLYFGDSSSILRRGAGHYMGSHFPGEGATILVSAHNNTYFNCLQHLKFGDKITVKTNYGIYEYVVSSAHIKDKNDPTAYNLSASEENLVLYTCYPFNALGLTQKRYFVTAKLISGPKVLLDE